MKMIGLLAALAMASAAPAMAMTSGVNHHGVGQSAAYAASSTVTTTAPEQCVRRIDARGNIQVICPNVREARMAWGARRPSYRGNYVVYYHDGRNVRMWKSWTRPPVRR